MTMSKRPGDQIPSTRAKKASRWDQAKKKAKVAKDTGKGKVPKTKSLPSKTTKKIPAKSQLTGVTPGTASTSDTQSETTATSNTGQTEIITAQPSNPDSLSLNSLSDPNTVTTPSGQSAASVGITTLAQPLVGSAMWLDKNGNTYKRTEEGIYIMDESIPKWVLMVPENTPALPTAPARDQSRELRQGPSGSEAPRETTPPLGVTQSESVLSLAAPATPA